MENTDNTSTQESPDGLIFYTDGGARPNPGFIGWGFHGYSYKEEKPKKGSGNSTHFPSAFGYIQKSAKDGGAKEVTPISYYDGFGCSTTKATNNFAELLAAKTVIEKAIDIKPKNFLIRTDSEYVRKGIVDWSPSWIRNNWVKADGNVVPNSSDWKDILSNIEKLREGGTAFKIEWVKGHSDVLGNNLADKLATVGVMSSTDGKNSVTITATKPEGYWKGDVGKDPFFTHKRMYFNTLLSSHIPGEYYLGDHGKDDEMLGKRMSDGAFSVIQLKTPEPIIELIRKTQTEMTGDLDTIVMLRLDEFFKPGTYNYIENYGKNGIVRPNKNRLDLYTLDSEPLTREIKPPRLAMRAIDALSLLKSYLLNYRDSTLDKDVKVIDITDHFFNKETITKKKIETTEYKLKPTFVSGFTALPINVEIEGKDIKIILTLGIDLPRRNNLKAMESGEIKVSMLLYKEADKSYRYLTIIESNGNYGIWGGIYSNILFVK